MILDTDLDFLPIPDPGSRIQKPPDSGSAALINFEKLGFPLLREAEPKRNTYWSVIMRNTVTRHMPGVSKVPLFLNPRNFFLIKYNEKKILAAED